MIAGSARIYVPQNSTGQGTDGGYDYKGTPPNCNVSAAYGKRELGERGFRKREVLVGPVYTDDVSFGAFTAKDMQMFVANKSTGTDNNALIGMEYKTASASNGNVTTFSETLIYQKAVQKPEFAFSFSLEIDDTKKVSGNGEITLGGRDSSKFSGDFVTAPVTKQGNGWNINIDGVQVNGQPLGSPSKVDGMYPSLPSIQSFLGLFADKHGFLGIFNTGQFRISGSKDTVELLFKNLPGAVLMPGESNYYSTGVDTYAYPCNTPPDKLPGFIIGKQALVLATRDMNNTAVDGKTATMLKATEPLCISNIFGSEAVDRWWSFGSPFMRSWYTVFQWGGPATGEEIGEGTALSFAKAVPS